MNTNSIADFCEANNADISFQFDSELLIYNVIITFHGTIGENETIDSYFCINKISEKLKELRGVNND